MSNKIKNIYIEITKQCNLNCIFCPSSNANNILDDSKKYLSIENFEYIIIQIKNYCENIYLHIMGEPLIHPQINEIIFLCEKYNLNVRITTNGTCLSNILYNKSVKKVNISLQSLMQLTTTRQIKYLDEIKNFIINKPPLLAIDLRLWNNKSIDKINIFNDTMVNYFQKILNNDISLVRFSTANEFVWPNLNAEINQTQSICLGGKKQLGILIDGTVTLCCLDYQGYTKIGNIFENSIRQILNDVKYQTYIKGFQNKQAINELCKRCTYRLRFVK